MMYITGGQFTDTIDKDVGFLINKWNEVVKENDTVLYVGDFIYSNEIDLRNIIEQLNGKICILQQNNGEVEKDKLLRNGIHSVFRVPFYLTIDDTDSKIIFNYEPEKGKIGDNYYIIFSKEAKIYNSETHTLNLYCGLWDYSPISLDMCPTILQNMIDFEKMEG